MLDGEGILVGNDVTSAVRVLDLERSRDLSASRSKILKGMKERLLTLRIR